MKMKTVIKGLVVAAAIFATGTFGTAPSSKAAGWVFPVRGSYRISQYFGGAHMGIDVAASTGTPVVAAASGVVTCANPSNSYRYVSSKNKYYCNYGCGTTNKAGIHVEIKYDNGLRSEYAHMNSATVTKGSRVYAGQVIGSVGATGNATGPHLHFSVAKATGATVWNGSQTFLNPMKYLSGASSSASSSNTRSVGYSAMTTTTVSQTNACLKAHISNPDRRVIQTVGAYIWDSNGNCVVNYTENCGRTLSSFDQMLNINTEAKKYLSSGRTYTWQFFAKSGSDVFYSAKAQFTTKAATSYVAYSNLRTTYLSTNNAKLAAAIYNPSGQVISHVGAYIWDENGNLVVNYSEYCGRKLKSFNQYLNVNTEAKKYLSSGRNYTWQFFAKSGSDVFYSAKAQFTTKAATSYVAYSNLRTTYRSRNNAKLAAAIYNPGGQVISYVGAYIWDENGNLVVNYSEYCGRKLISFNQYLNINTEAKKYLSSGRTYTWQFFAIADGKTYYSGKASFRTL